MHASLFAIEYYLPSETLTTEELSASHPEWSIANIDAKTGIHTRHIASSSECASDLAFAAVQKLFASGACQPSDVDFLILCTQSPDYFLPTTSCLLQHRLGIPTTAGALDVNLGCSGYVYGLGLAEGLVSSGQAVNVLLVTADTYSKFVHRDDKNTRAVFGDAGAATLLRGLPKPAPFLGPFIYGTDGSGATDLIVRGGAMRGRCLGSDGSDSSPVDRSQWISMNGARLFSFALREVPRVITELLMRTGLHWSEIDLFVFHQANRYLLNELSLIIGIPGQKCYSCISHCGNTVSSSLPIALKSAFSEGRLKRDSLVMLVGFGVGLSWAATLLRCADLAVDADDSTLFTRSTPKTA